MAMMAFTTKANLALQILKILWNMNIEFSEALKISETDVRAKAMST